MGEKLDDILLGLVDLEADSVTLEWASDGGLEVTMFQGSTGVGGIVTGPMAQTIMGEVFNRAKLGRRAKGQLKAQIRGRQMKFVVKEYDHFGESAFEIRVRS